MKTCSRPALVLHIKPREFSMKRRPSIAGCSNRIAARRGANAFTCPASQGQPATAVVPVAEMTSLWGSLDGFFVTTLTAAIIGGIAYSAIPLLNGEAKRRNEGRLDDSQGVEEADVSDVKWGVMTVLSFFPLFNWLVRICLSN
jgi:hypothetical protein